MCIRKLESYVCQGSIRGSAGDMLLSRCLLDIQWKVSNMQLDVVCGAQGRGQLEIKLGSHQ